jgi:hypothetical protein
VTLGKMRDSTRDRYLQTVADSSKFLAGRGIADLLDVNRSLIEDFKGCASNASWPRSFLAAAVALYWTLPYCIASSPTLLNVRCWPRILSVSKGALVTMQSAVPKILGDTVETIEKHYAPFVKELRERARRIMETGQGLEITGTPWAQQTADGRRIQ